MGKVYVKWAFTENESNEFSRDEIEEMYMQDILKIIDECCGIIQVESEDVE